MADNKEFSGGRVEDGVNVDRPWDSPVLKKKLPPLTDMVRKKKPPVTPTNADEPLNQAERIRKRNEDFAKRFGGKQGK